MIRAGSMRHVLDIEQSVLDTTPEGEEIQIWSKLSSARASINPINGTESFLTDQLRNEVSHKIGMRYKKLLPTNNRLIFEGRIFEIIAILNFQEKKSNILILVNEKV